MLRYWLSPLFVFFSLYRGHSNQLIPGAVVWRWFVCLHCMDVFGLGRDDAALRGVGCISITKKTISGCGATTRVNQYPISWIMNVTISDRVEFTRSRWTFAIHNDLPIVYFV